MSRSVVRRGALALCAAIALTIVSPVPASADAPTTVPVVTTPVDGQTVTEPDLTVTADSSALRVRFVVVGYEGSSAYDKTVSVSTGTASTQFSLLGLPTSTTLRAYDCDDAGNCNVGDFDSVPLTVDLVGPEITAPTADQVVGNSVTVKAKVPGAGVQFFVDGSPAGKDLSQPVSKEISLTGVADGSHTIAVRQCNADGTVCLGEEASVQVLKDTQGPRWTEVSTSNSTVFPVNDNYKDSTVLSARVSERSAATKVEIRKAGGPLVRTIALGRVDPGKVRATWNGRKSNGDVVPNGKYLFRFVGADSNGVVGKSADKPVYVSDKQLVRKTVSKMVSAKGSFYGNAAGACSGVYTLKYRGSRYGWPGGLGYYSRSQCNGNAEADLAFAFHKTAAPRAIRYGALRIDVYGGGAFRNAGPGFVVLYKANNDLGAGKAVKPQLGWHSGPRVNGATYVKNGKLIWGFGTIRGNWYDVKEFRITFQVSVLQ